MNADVAAVIAQVQVMCRAISGVHGTFAPTPAPLPTLGFPLCLIDARTPNLGDFSYTRLKLVYTVEISLLLGNPDMTRANAVAAAYPFYGRFANKFGADRTLGGTCDHSELAYGVSNFRGFTKKKAHPRLMWLLQVEHYGKPS